MQFFFQVLAEEGKAKAIAFDEIDKAPEEKARGITIATVCAFLLFWSISSLSNIWDPDQLFFLAFSWSY